MNKLTKIGVSALCGSLAAVSAQAGSMEVSGGATATYTTKQNVTVGNPLGMATGLSFKGTGELDNGNTFTVNIAHDDQNAFSAADLGVDIAGIGTITLDQGGGTGLDRLDDKMPTAWEESYDAGIGSSIATIGGVGASTDIEWAVSEDFLPEGLSAYVSYSFKAGAGKTNDKAVGGDGSEGIHSGYDLVVEHSGLTDGLNVFAGYSSIEQDAGATYSDDRTGMALGATFAVSMVTVGYQMTRDRVELDGGVDSYDNTAWGVSFNVNDDLSVSYGEHESDQNNGDTASTITLNTESLQAAYSMGGATVKVAFSSVDNSGYSTAANNDYDATSIALSLAF
jgi:outer membrane protein OmpU